jgi:arylsulfatase A-like enzyme
MATTKSFRRQFLKQVSPGTAAIAVAVATVFTLPGCSSPDDDDVAGTRPNIIFFLVDDMGWQDTSVPFWVEKTHFNGLYNTPNMERLAASGMKFTQAYVSSVCSPTRTSLMTGMNAARHGVTNWTLHRNISNDLHDDILEMPVWNINGLQPADTIENTVYATVLPKILQDNGYFTIHTGKAHWGTAGTPGSNPVNLGFDINIAGHAAGGLGSYLGEKNFGNEKGEHTLPRGVPGLEKYHGDSTNLTHVLTLEAIRALNQARGAGSPFYLYMSHYAVHTPLEPDYRFYQGYKDMGMEEPEARYASMLEGMDRSLGDLMDYLEEHGLSDNTVILFLSDNGGLSAHSRGGEPHTHNYPLKSGKGSAYEGGIRVPMIVRWPGVVEPGSVNNDCLIVEDFFPSILDIAGARNYRTVQQIDGITFVPLLRQIGLIAERRSLVWHYPNKWGAAGPGIGTTSTIRSGEWKLIYWYTDQQFELYNIHDDIGEHNNLADREPEKVKELAAELGEYLRMVNAFRPKFKASGEEVPWPDELCI